MGITDSKLLSATLSAACLKAEKNGRKEIKHILSDTQFIACLTKLWRHLPEHAKKQIYPGYKRNNQIVKTFKEDKIKLSDSLQSNIALWRNDPTSFLNVISSPYTGLNCPVIAIYQTLSNIEVRYSGDTIRLRFLKVLFHHLKDRCCANYLRRDAIEWMTSRIVRSGYDGGNIEIISSKIKDWAYVGGKYDALSRDIGEQGLYQDFKYLGNLFYLPEDITDRFMLKELPVKGDVRKKIIDSLVRRGILELDDIGTMNCLADHIFRTMWDNIESCICPDEQQEDVSASLMNWSQIQGARVIRFRNGNSGGQQRSNEIDMSQIDPTFAATPGRTDTARIDNVNANAAFPNMEEMAQIDPTNSTDPEMGNTTHINNANAVFPTVDGIAHIDPTNAVYPSMGNPSQMNIVGFQYPAMEGIPQIDPTNAIYPSMANTTRIDNASAALPAMEGVAHIDPTNAIYPSMANTTRIDNANAAFLAMEEVAHIDPMSAIYPSMANTAHIDNMNAVYPSMENTSQIDHANLQGLAERLRTEPA